VTYENIEHACIFFVAGFFISISFRYSVKININFIFGKFSQQNHLI